MALGPSSKFSRGRWWVGSPEASRLQPMGRRVRSVFIWDVSNVVEGQELISAIGHDGEIGKNGGARKIQMHIKRP